MPTLMKRLHNAAIATLMCATPFAAAAEEFRVMMLNSAADNANHTNVFMPDILRIKPDDTVTFIPTDSGHNTASKRGMIPDGAMPWNSPLDEEFSITLTVPGVCGNLSSATSHAMLLCEGNQTNGLMHAAGMLTDQLARKRYPFLG